MIITIRVLRVGGAPVERCVARGYLPSGQEVITGPIVTGTDAPARKSAIRAVVEWIFGHRPSWSIEIDDHRLGHTEVVP